MRRTSDSDTKCNTQWHHNYHETGNSRRNTHYSINSINSTLCNNFQWMRTMRCSAVCRSVDARIENLQNLLETWGKITEKEKNKNNERKRKRNEEKRENIHRFSSCNEINDAHRNNTGATLHLCKVCSCCTKCCVKSMVCHSSVHMWDRCTGLHRHNTNSDRSLVRLASSLISCAVVFYQAK